MNTARRTAHRVCPLCEAACGLELQVEGSGAKARVVSVKGHAADVFSHGYLCPKAVALMDLHDDPDRLRRPLVKRDGRHVEVSWDEAFAAIEQGLGAVIQRHGKDAVAISLGNPIVHKLGLGLAVPRLVKALATRNVYSASTTDQIPRQLVCGWMYGHWLSIPVPDIDHTDWLLVIGANPLASNGSLWTVPDFRGRAKALRARGGKLVVVDPRRTETAALADEHLAIRPGSDAFLLAALVRELVVSGHVNLGAAEPHVNPPRQALLATLTEALAPFTPERVAGPTGIDAATLRRLAADLAAAPRAAVYARMGAHTQRFGSLNAWLVDLLNLLTGRLDAEGGLRFPKAAAFAANTAGAPGKGRGVVTARHHSRVSQAPEVMGEFPITCLAEEIDTAGPGQVRGLVTIASNPVLSVPGAARLDRALEGLDFMVSVDLYLNETTRHADVILPGRSPFEDGHYDLAFTQLSTRNQVRYHPPVLSPAARGEGGAHATDTTDASDATDTAAAGGASPSEWQILNRLAGLAAGLVAQAQGQAAATTIPRDWAAVDALDDALLDRELEKLAATVVTARSADQPGPPAEVLAAMARQSLTRWQGPERWLDLALRTGPYGDGFGTRPPRADGAGGLNLVKLALAPQGIDLGPLGPRLPEVLRTPSGRVEALHAPLLAELNEAAQALARAEAGAPAAATAPPSARSTSASNDPPAAGPAAALTLNLIGRRDVRSNNSWMHNLPTLAKGPFRGALTLNPADAARLGLVEGARARMGRVVKADAVHASQADNSTLDVEIAFDAGLPPGVCCLPHGWGHDRPGARLQLAAQRPGANMNALLDAALRDPLSGNAVLSGVAVRVWPA